SSGQKINHQNSKLFFSPNVSPKTRNSISRECNFQITLDLGIYLEIPLLHKPIGKENFEPLLQNIDNRLSGWMARHLSLAGRVTLERSVIVSLSVYIMATLSIPKAVFEKIDQLKSSFVWVSWGTFRICTWLAGKKLANRRILEAWVSSEWRSLVDPSTTSWLSDSSMITIIIRLISKYIRPSLQPKSDPSPRGVSQFLTKGTCWQLRNGKTIRFRQDKWLIDRLLKEWANGTIDNDQLEETVDKFWSSKSGWLWHKFAPIIPASMTMKMAAVVVIEGEENPDTIKWQNSQDGNYLVSSTYGGEANVDRCVFKEIWKLKTQERVRYFYMFKEIWKLKTQEKVIYFCWLGIRDAILSNAGQKRHHLSNLDECPHCRVCRRNSHTSSGIASKAVPPG
ncbi:LOW QUALITY PROTEIN: hypothetical protein V2J09_012681, partial [Rumex salicifolius]